MSEIVERRIAGLQAALAERALDAVILGPSADMLHLIGRKLPLTERFNAVMLRRTGRPTAIVPRLQAPLVEPLGGLLDIHVWDEDRDPIALVADWLEGTREVAVNGHLWSRFLIALQGRRPGVHFSDASAMTAALRLCKGADEIAVLDDLGGRFDAIWDAFFSSGRLVGVTERDVVGQIRTLVLDAGFDELSWCDVGSGPNGASPLHHHSERVIQPGDPVVIDFAGTCGGTYMDTCRTPVAGEPHPDFGAIYDIVAAAHDAGNAAVRPGVPAEAVDAAARQVIEDAGYGPLFLHRLGHGLGLDAHEEPYIVRGNRLPLAPGMVFSNEPGIYVPGRWGVRIENIMVVTDDGVRSLNAATRALVSMN